MYYQLTTLRKITKLIIRLVLNYSRISSSILEHIKNTINFLILIALNYQLIWLSYI